MANWISLREFARRRDVTLQAVQKAIATNRISPAAVRRDDNGRLKAIDADQAAIDWHRNTDPELALRTGTVIPAPQADTASPGGSRQLVDLEVAGVETAPRGQAASDAAGDLLGEPAEPDSFRRDRAENERLKRVNGELDLAERMQLLVTAESVRRAAYESARDVHNKLIRMPDSLAPLLAAETDAVKIHALMSHAIREALNGLAERSGHVASA